MEGLPSKKQATPELPRHIIHEILLRCSFEVKDLLRLKCVSKSWFSAISDPEFVKAHLKHTLEKESYPYERLFFESRRIVLSTYHGSDYMAYDNQFGDMGCTLIGSSNGLVCVSTILEDIFVLNPSTREVKKLQKSNFSGRNRYLNWGFGYDSTIDDYKVVLGYRKGAKTGFEVLTLRSNTWKSIGVVNYQVVSRVGVFCNGALHWVAGNRLLQRIFLSFDLSDEEFVEIPQPNDGNSRLRSIHSSLEQLGVSSGCLCVFRRELWVMKVYKLKESWKKVDLSVFSCDYNMTLYDLRMLKPMERYIPTNDLLDRSWFPLDHVSLHFLGAPTFVESLISPNAGQAGTVSMNIQALEEEQVEETTEPSCWRSFVLGKG